MTTNIARRTLLLVTGIGMLAIGIATVPQQAPSVTVDSRFVTSRGTSGAPDVPYAASVPMRAYARQSPEVMTGTGSRLAALSPGRRARLLSEREEPGERFDEPDRAVEFYVNSRTGPILTRGPNATTGTRALDPSRYLPAIEQMRTMPRFDSGSNTQLPPRAEFGDEAELLTTWTPLGPANQGGRTRALLIHPTDTNLMYAGGVAGGVWKSTDGGANWTPLTDMMANIAITTLAFDPADSNTIYAGTGEGFFNGDAIRGAGIFRSTDAGTTWTQLATTNNSNFHYTTKLLVSPRTSQRLFATTRAGFFRSIDGGASWTLIVSGTSVNGCTDMALQTQGATGFVFFSCGNFTQGTVYRILDNDTSTQESIFAAAGIGRTSIAVAPSNQAVVYLMSAQGPAGGAGPGRHGLHGVYRSTANGDPGTFTTQRLGNVAPANTQERIYQLLLSNPVYGVLADCGFGASNQNLNQGWYDNVIAVDPLDANRVWAGGVDLWRSDDGGVTWGTAGYWWFDKGVDPEYHHADQHGLVFHPQYNGTSNRVLFSTSDGGVERIDDARAPLNTTLAQICGTPITGGASWIDRNNGYVTTQFYAGVPYPNGQTFFGGLQDNGTQSGTSASQNWVTLLGGDGGYTAVDTLGDGNPANDVLFGEYTGLSIQRSTDGGANFSNAVTGISGDSSFLFIAPFTMNQTNKQQMWTGGRFVWRTTNQATMWTRASAASASLGSVSAIATHPLDGNRVLVGMSDGYILNTVTGLSNTSTTVWPSTQPTSSYISWVAWDPTNVDVAYATVSAFASTTLLKSTNGGASWSPSMGSGSTALPQVPALSVVVDPTDGQHLFVGTDLGVFVSIDGGASWMLENTGFARTPVEAVAFNESAPRRLFAFTHGRGAWSVTIAECSAIVITPASLPGGTAGVAYSQALSASGGTAPYSFSVAAGALPDGLALTAAGVLSGTPVQPGTFGFTVRATDATGCQGLAAFSITIAQPTSPQPATDFRVDSVSGGRVRFRWTAPRFGPAPENYVLEGGTSSTTVLASISTGSTATVFEVVVPTGSWVAWIRTQAGGTLSARSNEVSVLVNVPVAPSAPTNFTGLVNGTSLALSWKNTFAGGPPTGLMLDVGGAISTSVPLGLGESFAFTGVPPGTYSLQLRAVNGGGSSSATEAITLTFPGSCSGAPLPPTNFLAYKVGSVISVLWDPPATGAAPTSYSLEVTGSFVGTFPLTARHISSPVPPGSYTFTISSVNACGQSAATAAQTVVIP